MSATSGFVAQIFNLLYRRVSLGRASNVQRRNESSHAPQSATLRYGRLEICVRIQRAGAPIPESGFTSVELLVVLAVIAALAATLLPALAKSRPNVQALQCLNNHRQLCAARRMYADDSHDRIVYASDDGIGSSNPLNQYAWTLSHLDYTSNSKNWDTNVDIVLRPLWPYTGKDASIYRCPSDRSFVVVNGAAKPRVRSMTLNFYLGGYAGTDLGFASTYRLFLKSTDLTAPGPAKTFVLLDRRQDGFIGGAFSTDMSGYPTNSPQHGFLDLPGMYHNLGCTFSFADGRAEIKCWRDARTTPPLQPGAGINDSFASPRNPDVAGLQDHATRPK